MMLQLPIGFGWFILAAFLFGNLVWFWDTADHSPSPSHDEKKTGSQIGQADDKKGDKTFPALPMAQLHQLSARKPVAQPIP
ncbi:MAG: hypothetical protein MPW15_18115 [Candidatus Manganitrophus sp.]|nr:hypothetical protein [Candidatus Manganitrophus sp.]